MLHLIKIMKHYCDIITKEQEQEIIYAFLHEKISLTDLAKKYNRKSKDFIYKILDKYNINKTRRHIANKFSEQEIQEIIKIYQTENFSCAKIGEKYKVSESTIVRILKNNGVAIRRHWANTFDENYFDIIDSSNKAYLLGFLYADGCINKNNVVSIVVHHKDVEILEMFKKELQASNNIKNVKSKPHVRVDFCSKHLCDSLKQIGCGHNKTLYLSFPNISKEFIYDFIRGFMDGDGCISVVNRDTRKYISLSFTGTLEMLQELKLIFNVDNKITFYRNSYALHIGKTSDVLRILNNIYNEADLYMTRKYNKYQEYLKWLNDKKE